MINGMDMANNLIIMEELILVSGKMINTLDLVFGVGVWIPKRLLM